MLPLMHLSSTAQLLLCSPASVLKKYLHHICIIHLLQLMNNARFMCHIITLGFGYSCRVVFHKVPQYSSLSVCHLHTCIMYSTHHIPCGPSAANLLHEV